jgi:hypothetical protein
MKDIQQVINDYKEATNASYSEIVDGKKIIDLAKEKSVKEERRSLRDQIYSAACDYVRKHIDICHKLGFNTTKFDDEISTTRGSMSVSDIDFNKQIIDLNYSDSWAYGGHCDIDFYISFKELIEFNEENFTKQKAISKIKELESHMKSLEVQIANQKKTIEELSKEYNITSKEE